MYSKNYIVGDEASPENINVPPQYSGNAIYHRKEQYREQPYGESDAPSYREIDQTNEQDEPSDRQPFTGAFKPIDDDKERFRNEAPPPPPPPYQPPPPPPYQPPPPPPYQPPPPPPPSPHQRSGLLDRFSSEDLIIFGAAAMLVFRDQDDLLSLGILLLIILM